MDELKKYMNASPALQFNNYGIAAYDSEMVQ